MSLIKVSFNSIKVQLRHVNGVASPDAGSVFQFHKGTIKTSMCVPTPIATALSIP